MITVDNHDEELYKLKLGIRKSLMNTYRITFNGDSFRDHSHFASINRLYVTDDREHVALKIALDQIDSVRFKQTFEVDLQNATNQVRQINDKRNGLWFHTSKKLNAIEDEEINLINSINKTLKTKVSDICNSAQMIFSVQADLGITIGFKSVSNELLTLISQLFKCTNFEPKIETNEIPAYEVKAG